MISKIDTCSIGKSIRALRLKNHLTQVELADLVGYSVRNIRRIENYGTGSIDIVNTFAGAFNVSALDILTEDVFLCKKTPKRRTLAIFTVHYLFQSVIHTQALQAKRMGAAYTLLKRIISNRTLGWVDTIQLSQSFGNLKIP